MTEPDNTLADRVEQARVRSNELAANAANRAREFVHDHPVASVAGGIAVGALIAGALSRRKRHRTLTRLLADTTEGAADAATAHLTRIAAIGAELALAYVARAASLGKDGVEKGAEAGHKVAGLAEIALTTLQSGLHRLTHRDPD